MQESMLCQTLHEHLAIKRLHLNCRNLRMCKCPYYEPKVEIGK